VAIADAALITEGPHHHGKKVPMYRAGALSSQGNGIARVQLLGRRPNLRVNLTPAACDQSLGFPRPMGASSGLPHLCQCTIQDFLDSLLACVQAASTPTRTSSC